MSARAAAQLEYIGFGRDNCNAKVHHYIYGKADWIVRGLPTEPRAPLLDRIAALPYFANNLAPGFRSAWIRLSRRVAVGRFARDDLDRLAPDSRIPSAVGRGHPTGVVLNPDRVLLGAIEIDGDHDGLGGRPAFEAMNPAPQTIRPDMTQRLAAMLLRSNPYLLITDAFGRYMGSYDPPS